MGCGYLLRFCLRQFAAENLNFVIEVNRFREVCNHLLSLVGISEWNSSWQDLDTRIQQQQYSNEYLSQTVSQLIRQKLKNETNVKLSVFEKLCNEAERRKQYIYDTFISNEAEAQICLSNDVLTNTLRRMSQISVWFLLFVFVLAYILGVRSGGVYRSMPRPHQNFTTRYPPSFPKI